MSSNTTNLNLLKMDPVTDGADTFNIETMLNENWDKIDAAANESIPNSLSTASDQVPVSSGIGTWASKTLAQFKAWLGLGSAAYTASTAYATSTQGAEADTTATTVTAHLADDVRHITAAERTSWNSIVKFQCIWNTLR